MGRTLEGGRLTSHDKWFAPTKRAQLRVSGRHKWWVSSTNICWCWKRGTYPTLKLTADILATGRLVPNMELEHQGVFFPRKIGTRKQQTEEMCAMMQPKKRTGFLHRFPNFYGYKKNVPPDGILSQKDGVVCPGACSQISIDMQGGGLLKECRF